MTPTRPITNTTERMREAWRWTDSAVVERYQADAALRAYLAGDQSALTEYHGHISRALRYGRKAAEVRATQLDGRKAMRHGSSYWS